MKPRKPANEVMNSLGDRKHKTSAHLRHGGVPGHWTVNAPSGGAEFRRGGLSLSVSELPCTKSTMGCDDRGPEANMKLVILSRTEQSKTPDDRVENESRR
jgi:hypothetical protein